MSTLEEVAGHSLSADARRVYDRDGFLVMRGLFRQEEIARLASSAEGIRTYAARFLATRSLR